MKTILELVLQVRVPGRRSVRLRPEITHVIGTTHLATDEVVNLARLAVRIGHASSVMVSRVAIQIERLCFHRRRDKAFVFTPLGGADRRLG